MNEIDFKNLIRNVYDLIYKYFNNKQDAGGNNYLYHLYYVANAIDEESKLKVNDENSSLGIFYKKAYIVGLLHDIFEDTNCTEDELINLGCDKEIIDAIKSVTRLKEEQYYFDFIKRASKNDIGRIVKKYDLEHNMDVRRLKTFGEYEQKRLKKYWYSWKYLCNDIDVVTANNIIHPDRKCK